MYSIDIYYPTPLLLSTFLLFFLFFIGSWTEISQRRMLPFAIIEHFNIFKHCCFCFLPCLIDGLADAFFFERSPKAFDHGVIITITFSAHTHLDPSLMQQVLVALTGIFAPSVRMMDQAHCRIPLAQRHL